MAAIPPKLLMGPVSWREYIDEDAYARMRQLADTVDTPCLIMDTASIKAQYEKLAASFSFAKIYYAVKANPAVGIVQLLANAGASFDIASRYELDMVLGLGVDPSRVCYGNTVKKARDIRYFHERGCQMYVTDSENDLRHIARAAPGSRLLVRILVEGSDTADWPLSKKFGCQPDMAQDLIVLAKNLGLVPYGISFHVGSQQYDPDAWGSAILKAKDIFDRVEESAGISLKLVNIGGGIPAHYISRVNTLETYGQVIKKYLDDNFGHADEFPEVIIEPGRGLVADAGMIASEVVLVSRKSKYAIDRWVFCDIGKFGGLIETTEESIKYPLCVDKQGELEEVILAGPTCDSADILYEKFRYSLPLNLASGDRLYFLSTGAYTSSYSSCEFNGFPPLKVYLV